MPANPPRNLRTRGVSMLGHDYFGNGLDRAMLWSDTAQQASGAGRFTVFEVGRDFDGGGSARGTLIVRDWPIYAPDWERGWNFGGTFQSYANHYDFSGSETPAAGKDSPYDVLTESVEVTDLPAGTVGYTDVLDNGIIRVRLAEKAILTRVFDPNDPSTFDQTVDDIHHNETQVSEELAHEFGHVALILLERMYGEAWVKQHVCEIFGRPESEWDVGAWEDQVKEAACEVFKDVMQGRRLPHKNYYDERGRKFFNRTHHPLDFGNWDKWKDVYLTGLFKGTARDNYPWQWNINNASLIPDYGRGSWVDFGNGEVPGQDYVPGIDGPNPYPGSYNTDFNAGPVDFGVIYYGQVLRNDIGFPTKLTYDQVKRFVYYGDPTQDPDQDWDHTNSPFTQAVRDEQKSRTRTLGYHPLPGQTLTIRADWGRPPSVWGSPIPDWSGWRYSGRMLGLDPTNLVNGNLAVPGACLAVWQQTFNPDSNFNDSGDEVFTQRQPGVNTWQTVSDQSFKLPQYLDNPNWAHDLTVPSFSPDAINVRLRLNIGGFYWDNGARECFNIIENPLDSVVSRDQSGNISYVVPTVPFVYRGFLTPVQWLWPSGGVDGAYWELDESIYGPAGDGRTGKAFTNLLAQAFPSRANMWALYRPDPDTPVIGNDFFRGQNLPTTGLPWGSGVDFAVRIHGADGPAPPMLRDSVWPYGGDLGEVVEVPGVLNDGSRVHGVARRNVKTVGIKSP